MNTRNALQIYRFILVNINGYTEEEALSFTYEDIEGDNTFEGLLELQLEKE